MKKIGLMVVAACLSLSVAASAADQPKAERSTTKGKVVKGTEAQTKALNAEIAQLKQEHQAAINELQEIRKLAAEEKATRTVAALDKLIARHNQEFQKKLDPRQQRLNKLEGKSGEKSGDTGTKQAPKKGAPK